MWRAVIRYDGGDEGLNCNFFVDRITTASEV